MDLQAYIEEHAPDVCAITETWFHKDISSNELALDGYTIFRQDRKLSFYEEGTYVREDRGGALLLIKTDLNPQRVYEDTEAEVV